MKRWVFAALSLLLLAGCAPAVDGDASYRQITMAEARAGWGERSPGIPDSPGGKVKVPCGRIKT